MADTRRYVDKEGLSIFLTQLKEKYASNTASSFVVNHALEADKLATARTITLAGDASGSVSFNGSQDVTLNVTVSSASTALQGVIIDSVEQTIVDHKAVLDLSNYAKKSEISGVLKFMGSCTGDELAQKEMVQGHVWFCTATGTTSETSKYKKDYEYACNGEAWVELGGPIDLSDYKKWSETKTYVDEAVQGAKDYADTLNAAMDSRVQVVEGKAHEHTNLDLLETYTQTEANLADAVTKKHEHSNKNVLDDITSARVSQWDAAQANVIETVKVNGTALEVVDKAVNVDLSAYATNEALAEEATTRATADTAEATTRADEDVKELKARNAAIDDAFNLELHVVGEHEIRKMFGEESTYQQPTGTVEEQAADLKNKVQAIESGDTLNITVATVADATTQNRGIEITGTSAAPYSGTIDLSNGGSITAGNSGNARVLHLGENSTLEIVGGTISNTSDNNPTVAVWNDASLILDGTTLTNSGAQTVISSNGNNTNSNIIIKNATITGACYFPACGNLVIENSTIVASENASSDSCAVYVKSGNVTVKNSVFKGAMNGAGYTKGAWKHGNSGFYGPACAFIIEHCNYNNNGNVNVNIDSASTFTAGDAGSDFDAVGILVINYNGNTGTNNINQKYYVANVTESTIVEHKFTLDGRDGSIKLVEVNG